MEEARLIKELVGGLEKLTSQPHGAPATRAMRKEAAEVARKLWLELEEGGDLIDRYIYAPIEINLLRLALDVGLYEYLASHDGAISCHDLAKGLSTDEVLLQRVLRCLAALGHVDETNVNEFAANKFTRAFTTPKDLTEAVPLVHRFEFAAPAWNAIPAYLKSTRYRNPSPSVPTAMQYGFATSKPFFELLNDHGMTKNFSELMASFRDGRAEFLEIFPFAERVLEAWSPGDSVLLVDVGGGRGHDIERIVERFPETRGHMILQDQEEVLKQGVNADAMQTMAHDFFKAQPIKGARVYYMRMILHDWHDDQCVSILENIASVMTPGYSKLLVNDIVMPERGATRFATQSDLAMMTLLSAMERTESQWRTLFARANLSVSRLWQASPESVFELELCTDSDQRDGTAG